MNDFSKTVRIGTAKTYGGRSYSIFCRIEVKAGKLSITGVEGPLPSGNCFGACGQIDMHLAKEQNTITPAPGWDRAKLSRFFKVWDDWHLNDMRAGTPKQTAYLETLTFPGYPVSHYEWACAELAKAGINPDPDNGYKYGSAWLHEEIPTDVLEFLRGLPETDRQPAWV